MPDFDVVVAGCGPAGNTVAYRLATAGARVLMLDGERLPRHKVCGGGLSRKTLAELPFSVAPVVEREVAGAFIAYGGAEAVYCAQPGIGAMVQRHAFDAFMAGRAVAAGAALWDGCALEGFESRTAGVAITTARGPVTARVLVGADGVYSRVRRGLYPGARAMVVPAIEALVATSPQSLAALGERCVFDLGAIPAGYAWVFPKGDHFNVGLYRFAKRRDNLAMRALLERFVASCPILRDHGEVRVKALVIPVRPVAARLACNNVVLVGDAAGVGDAFYGEGIYYAVRSANLAAGAIAGYLGGSAPLAAYDRTMRGLRRQLLAARLTARLFYLSPRLAYRYAVRKPAVNGLFAGVIGGSVTPTRCLVAFLLRAPRWLLSRAAPPATVPARGDGPPGGAGG